MKDLHAAWSCSSTMQDVICDICLRDMHICIFHTQGVPKKCPDRKKSKIEHDGSKFYQVHNLFLIEHDWSKFYQVHNLGSPVSAKSFSRKLPKIDFQTQGVSATGD